MMDESKNPRAMRWLTRSVLGIGLASLFSDASHETVTSVLPAYLASMGAAAAALGTIEGVADGLSSAAKLYGGWLADRLQRRKPLCAAGYGFMAVATLIIAAATSWGVVLGGRVFAWISRGLRTPARKALLSEAVPKEAYGRAFGFERAMDTVGAIIAPLSVLVLLAAGADTPHSHSPLGHPGVSGGVCDCVSRPRDARPHTGGQAISSIVPRVQAGVQGVSRRGGAFRRRGFRPLVLHPLRDQGVGGSLGQGPGRDVVGCTLCTA